MAKRQWARTIDNVQPENRQLDCISWWPSRKVIQLKLFGLTIVNCPCLLLLEKWNNEPLQGPPF
jgi:hypothetical protein